MTQRKERALILVPNWLGDSVMAMPAVQLYSDTYPGVTLEVLAKKSVASLWRLHPSVSAVHQLESSARGTLDAAKALRHLSFDSCFVLPHSFRAALIAWLARIPRRIGLAGRGRSALLTEKLILPPSVAKAHQAYEYRYLLTGDDAITQLPGPTLQISSSAVASLQSRFALGGRTIGVIPGAARGPSKQWPIPYFIELVRKITGEGVGTVVLIGTPDERELCEEIRVQVGPDKVINLAGQTTLSELPGLLRCCELVVCNDSGGMHLASAVGVRVVALFGITDPSKTGPLGSQSTVLQKSEIRSKAVPRHSPEAIEALARITPHMAFDAVVELLG